MKRTCDNCGMPLHPSKSHGFVVGGRVVCGNAKDCDKARKLRGVKG